MCVKIFLGKLLLKNAHRIHIIYKADAAAEDEIVCVYLFLMPMLCFACILFLVCSSTIRFPRSGFTGCATMLRCYTKSESLFQTVFYTIIVTSVSRSITISYPQHYPTIPTPPLSQSTFPTLSNRWGARNHKCHKIIYVIK